MSRFSDFLARFQPAPSLPVRSWDGYDMAVINGLQYGLGMQGLNQTLGNKIEDIDVGYENLATRAYGSNSVVYACMRARRSLFTEARFGFQEMSGTVPGDFWRDGEHNLGELAILSRPWPGATTGDLLKFMITDVDLAGNAFVLRRNGRLIRLRPDWVRIVHGNADPDATMWDVDSVLDGYAYQPGGPRYARPWVHFDPTEVAHFSTTPDPLLPVRGMTWLSSIVREVMSDEAMTTHKLMYHEHGATPNLVLKTEYTDTAKLKEFMDYVIQNHAGTRNAYKMMGFTMGVEAVPIGTALQQDFKVIQGAGETRIASAAGVPPNIALLSEGMQGASLNAGQGFTESMRLFADMTMSELWRNVSGSLESVIRTPQHARLWYDTRGIPALKDDIRAAAEVRQKDAAAMSALYVSGFYPKSIVKAIVANDWNLLDHSGQPSIQVQPVAPTTPAADTKQPPDPKQLPPGGASK